jgi:hypothetical protein
MGFTLPDTIYLSDVHEGSNLPKHKTGYSHEIYSVDVRRATLIWNILINFLDTKMKIISYVFFDTILAVSNMRHFKSQQIALDHLEEEREVNRIIRDNCGVDVDSEARDLEDTWLREDLAKGVCTSAIGGGHVVPI